MMRTGVLFVAIAGSITVGSLRADSPPALPSADEIVARHAEAIPTSRRATMAAPGSSTAIPESSCEPSKRPRQSDLGPSSNRRDTHVTRER